MKAVLAIAALAACNVPATKFTPIGGGSGSGSAASLSVSPSGDVALGTVIVGQTGSKTQITVSNDGDMDSGPINLGFDDPTLGFTPVDDLCSGSPLSGHTTCTFSLDFAPVTAVAAQTNMHVTADPGGDVSKVVLGTGLLQGQIDITDASYMYPNTGLGATPMTKVFTIRNTGQSQVGAPVPTTSSGDPSYMVMSATCNMPLNMSDTCTVTVAFAPGSVGAKAGSLVVTSTPGGSDVASLSGTGFAHLTVQNIGNGSGTVGSNPAGIDCGIACGADFTSTPVALGVNSLGNETGFGGWGGACSGTGACSVALTANKMVTATFSLNNYPVSVGFTSGNPGQNTITSSPAGISCDGANGCTGNFAYGTQVTLTANPDATTGRFNGWTSGACLGLSNPCTITVPSGGTSTQGTFGWFATLTILKNLGDGGFMALGTQANATGGVIACSNTTSLTGTCMANLTRNQTITLTYSGAPSSAIWTNCQGGTAMKFVGATASGNFCTIHDGIICSTTLGCPGSESCTVTLSTPGDYTSEYDVSCEQ
jgi:hypothetical protein